MFYQYPTNVPVEEITYLANQVISRDKSSFNLKDAANAAWAIQGYLQSKVLGQSALAVPSFTGEVTPEVIRDSLISLLPRDPNAPAAQGLLSTIGTKLLLSFVQSLLVDMFSGNRDFAEIIKKIMAMITGELAKS